MNGIPQRPAGRLQPLFHHKRLVCLITDFQSAVRDNVRVSDGDGVVIGTEYEPNKAAAARANFEQAGLSRFVDLREGDLRQTLKEIDGPVDFMLMDIWITMARPALEVE